MKNEILECIKFLQRVFKIREQITVSEVIESMNMDIKYVMVALTHIIEHRYTFKNRLGFNLTINEHNNILFLNADPFYNADADIALYSTYLLGLKNYEGHDLLEEYNSIIRLDNVKKLSDQIDQAQNEMDVMNILVPLDSKTRVILFEESFVKIFNNKDSIGDRILFEKFKNKLFKFEEPVSEINALIRSKRATKKGRKEAFGKGGKEKIRDVEMYSKIIPNELSDVNKQDIYVHELIPVISKSLQIKKFLDAIDITRVFKPSEGRWRNLNIIERDVYTKIISNFRQRIDIMAQNNQLIRHVGIFGFRVNNQIILKELQRGPSRKVEWKHGKQIANLPPQSKKYYYNIIREILFNQKKRRGLIPQNENFVPEPLPPNTEEFLNAMNEIGFIFDEVSYYEKAFKVINIDEIKQSSIIAEEEEKEDVSEYPEEDLLDFLNKI